MYYCRPLDPQLYQLYQGPIVVVSSSLPVWRLEEDTIGVFFPEVIVWFPPCVCQNIHLQPTSLLVDCFASGVCCNRRSARVARAEKENIISGCSIVCSLYFACSEEECKQVGVCRSGMDLEMRWWLRCRVAFGNLTIEGWGDDIEN
jgi:hypothetical protein